MKELIEDTLNRIFDAISYQKNQPHVFNQFPDHNSLNGDSTVCYGRLIEYSQRLTLGIAAEIAIENSGGNILEIGCAEGWATCMFAEIAKKYGVKVYCIDPYNGEQEGTEKLYFEFQKTIARYPNQIIHLREPSQSKEAKEFLDGKHISFAFVDGLHTKQAAIHDIYLALSLMKSKDVICVDDTHNYTNKDAGAAMIEAVDKGLISKIMIDKLVEDAIFSHKSWHFGIKN